MAFTQTDLDRLNAAIASGVLTVEYDGERRTFQDMASLMKAKAMVEAELANAAGAPINRQTFASFTRD